MYALEPSDLFLWSLGATAGRLELGLFFLLRGTDFRWSKWKTMRVPHSAPQPVCPGALAIAIAVACT